MLKSANQKSNGNLKILQLIEKSVNQVIYAKALKGNSLGLFSHDSRLRKFLYKIARTKFYENGVLFLILVSTLILCSDDYLMDPNSTKKKVLDFMD